MQNIRTYIALDIHSIQNMGGGKMGILCILCKYIALDMHSMQNMGSPAVQ